MGLFTPVWKSTDYRKRDKAISKIKTITDPQKLREIALEAVDPDVIRAALNRIEDDQILYDYAGRSEPAVSFRLHAMTKIKDPALVRKLLPMVDVNKLTDPGATPGAWPRYYVDVLYKKMKEYGDVPPELSRRVTMPQARADFLKSLSTLVYPRDAEQIRDHARYALQNEDKIRAIDMLPYASEKAFLEELLTSSGVSVPVKLHIARKLPDDSELLKKDFCLGCGGLDTLTDFDEYRQSADLFVYGYRCRVCGKEESSMRGQTPDYDWDFKLTLKDRRKLRNHPEV